MMNGQGNNNGAQQVLTGNRTAQRPGMQAPGQPQQPQQQTNPLAQLAAAASRFSGGINGNNNGMSSLYSYGAAKTNYASLIGLEDTIGEEQLKAQAIQEGGMLANSIVNICVHRKQGNPMYASWRAALERFKHPRKNTPQDPPLVNFVNDIDSNQSLHHFILIHAGIQFGAEFAYRLMKGDETVRNDRNVIQDILYRCCIDTVNLQFIDYLGTNSQVFYQLSNMAKETLIELEPQLYDQVLARYVFAGMECPFRKGILTNVTQNSAINNPILNSPLPGDLGMGGSIFDLNGGLFGHNTASTDNQGLQEMNRWLAEQVRRNQSNVGTTLSEPNYYHDPNMVQVSYDSYDKPELKLADMTRENRHQYDLMKYATRIPNQDWFLIREFHVLEIMKHMDTDDGREFRIRDTRVLGTVPVYRIDWRAGTFNYKLVKHNLQSSDIMELLISDPEKLLPFMYEEDGIQRTTFDPLAMETSKFVRDGVVVPMGEMKELEKQPDLLVGNRPMKANLGNESTVNRVNVFTETHDPKGKLNAFVLPMVNTREWTMEPDVNMDRFYSQFKVMIQGNDLNMTDTARVIRTIRGNCVECESSEFKAFIEPYLTNLVNRWLIEARGYAETKSDTTAPYLKIGNIFEDLEDLIEALKETDHPALRSFMDYTTNDFLRGGIEILLPKEAVEKEYQEKYKGEEDEVTRSILISAGKRAIIIKRNSVFINMIQANGPYNLGSVVIKESGNPELFAVVRKAIKVASRHFDDVPQVLVKFHKDEGNKVWALTRSEFDPESVFVLRAVDSGQDYVHPYPICD